MTMSSFAHVQSKYRFLSGVTLIDMNGLLCNRYRGCHSNYGFFLCSFFCVCVKQQHLKKNLTEVLRCQRKCDGLRTLAEIKMEKVCYEGIQMTESQ